MIKKASIKILLLMTPVLVAVASSNIYEEEQYDIVMPNLRKNMMEVYLCTSIRLNSSTDFYLTKFDPKATVDKVHHMIVFGCLKPGSNNPVWRCGDASNSLINSEYEHEHPCKSNEMVLYDWARSAPSLTVPPGVGYRVGSDTGVQHLVLETHYVASGSNDSDAGTNTSGVTLHYTRQPLSKIAGNLLLATNGSIPAMSDERWESSCMIVENKTIHPFAFRVHTHHLGTVVAGYRVRPDSDGKNHWTLIGRKSPQKPHMFYPMDKNIILSKGDIVASRCTYHNNRKDIVHAGPTDNDEMCNYYVLYYVEGGKPLEMTQCWTKGAPFYYWDSELNNIPADASALDLSA